MDLAVDRRRLKSLVGNQDFSKSPKLGHTLHQVDHLVMGNASIHLHSYVLSRLCDESHS